MTGWYDTVDSEVIHEGWTTLRVDTVRMPDGSTARREVADHHDAVNLVHWPSCPALRALIRPRHVVNM